MGTPANDPQVEIDTQPADNTGTTPETDSDLPALLQELKGNLNSLQGKNSEALVRVRTDVHEMTETVMNIKTMATIVFDVVEEELKPEQAEGAQVKLDPLLKKHYIEIVKTLNAALTETDVEAQKKHAKELEELSSVSKPVLKTALHALAGFLLTAVSLIIATKAGAFIAATLPATTVAAASLGVGVSLSQVAGKVGNQANAFYDQGMEHVAHAKTVHTANQRIASGFYRKKKEGKLVDQKDSQKNRSWWAHGHEGGKSSRGK